MAHHDVAMQRVVVERMHRLAQFQHHVVGDVDHRTDRPQMGAPQPLGHPQRRACGRIDTLDDAPQVTRRILACLQPDPAAYVGADGNRDRRGELHGAAEQRRHIVGQAVQAEAIGTIGREAELDAGIGQAQIGGQRLPHRCIGRQFQQAGRVGIDRQLFGRAKHAVRFDATQFRCLYRHAVGQFRAHHRQRNLDAGAGIRRATHDLQRLAQARVHLANLQAIGLRVPFGGDDLRHDDVLKAFAQGSDVLDLQASHRQRANQGIAIGIDLDQFTQPVLGKIHCSDPGMGNSEWGWEEQKPWHRGRFYDSLFPLPIPV